MSLLKRIEKGTLTPADQPSKLREIAARRAPTSVAPSRDAYLDLKTRIQNKLLAELDPSMDISKTDEVRSTIEEMFDATLAEENIILSRVERQRLFEHNMREFVFEDFNGFDRPLFLRRQGRTEHNPIKFRIRHADRPVRKFFIARLFLAKTFGRRTQIDKNLPLGNITDVRGHGLINTVRLGR